MSLKLSKENGVNPTMIVCQYCGEPKNVVLTGALGDTMAKKMGNNDGKMPRMIRQAGDVEPCDKCKEQMLKENHITIISVKMVNFDGEWFPEPTGTYLPVPKEAIDPNTKGYGKMVKTGFTLMHEDEFEHMTKNLKHEEV